MVNENKKNDNIQGLLTNRATKMNLSIVLKKEKKKRFVYVSNDKMFYFGI